MKTRTALLWTALLLVAINSFGSDNRIRGNGNIITKTIAISDYDEIAMAGSMQFEYEQSSASPYLEITVDENIFPYLQAEVKGNKLIVGTKTEDNGRGRKSYNISPTVYKIKSNSRNLRKLDTAGSGRFIVNSPLNISSLVLNTAGSGGVEFKKEVNGNSLKANLAGSGKIIAYENVKMDQTEASLAGSGRIEFLKKVNGAFLKANLAGSGKIKANNIQVRNASCSLSSSGEMIIEGSTKEISYSIAGSGKIKAFDCKADKVNSSINGSGKIELYAAKQLSASVMGSGNISYKGNPSINKSTSGSGSIRHIN